MMTLPKIDRRTWLALWAQGRRRNRLRFGHPALLPAPVLRAAYPDLLRWDWVLPNPFKWNVWMSLNGGASWMLIEDYWMYGDARQFAPDGGGELYYIVGIDQVGNEITEHSNLIRPDDALLPAPVLRPAFPDLLQWDWDLPNPFKWNVWQSLNGGASYILVDGYWMYGDARQFAPDGGGELHFIVGVDEAGNEVTERSNAVRPDDALYPPPWVDPQFPDKAVWNWGLQNPYRWNAYCAVDLGENWQIDGYVEGDAREYVPSNASAYVRMVGVNADGVEVTERSNAVRPVDAPAPVNLLSELKAYWAMECNYNPETDLSGNGNDLYADASPKVAGFMGLAYDAAGDTGGYYPGMSTITAFLDYMPGFSISFWFYGNFPMDTGFDLLATSNVLAVSGGNSGGVQNITASFTDNNHNVTTVDLADGYNPFGWNHVVITWSANAFAMYHNGQLVSSVDISSTYTPTSIGQLSLGMGGFGLFDEMGVWSRAIFPSEVASLYNYGSGLSFEYF